MRAFEVNIVSPHSGWILDFIAERIIKANKELGTGVKMLQGTQPRNDVDVNYYVDVYNTYWGKSEVLDVGWLTAFHEGFSPDRAMSLDFITFENKKYLEEMVRLGYPREYTAVIYPGVFLDKFPLKKTTLGVFQKGIHRDKGHDFMLSLPKILDLHGFRFLFVGEGWGDVVELYVREGIDASQYPEDYEKYSNYYDSIDYLLVPSLLDGGPVCVLEALAKGIPIIASKVGLVEDFGVEYTFEPGNALELAEILTHLEKKKLERKKKVENVTWKNYARKLVELLKSAREWTV